jgi:hypothetical protein
VKGEPEVMGVHVPPVSYFQQTLYSWELNVKATDIEVSGVQLAVYEASPPEQLAVQVVIPLPAGLIDVSVKPDG